MARKSTTQPAVDKVPQLNETGQAATRDADERNSQLATIDARFGQLEPYNRERVIQEARFFMGQSAEAMLEAGKRLLLLKEHEQHGEFMTAVAGLGLNPSAASRMMAATLKFTAPNLPTSANLPALGKSKLFELLVLDDEQVKELAEGGTVAGMDMDDVSAMTVTELRDALRTAREDATANESVIDSKNRKIDQLETTLKKKTSAKERTAETAAAKKALLKDVNDVSLELIHNLDALDEAFAAIHEGDAPLDHDLHVACDQALVIVIQRLVNTRNRFHLEANYTEEVVPPWAVAARS